MKPTVAIVGSHPRTREEFDFDRTDCDIWLFNEAMSQPWAKRADGVFQLHKPVIWRSKTNRNDPFHGDWLKSGNTPTIFMQEQYEEVPRAEKYPLDEVLTLSQGIRFLTSSIALAIALAIHKGYKRIEIYGVEMETTTEYGEQRQGVAFWAGIAIGRGIELDFHNTNFFAAPIYGYEGNHTIPLERFENRRAELKAQTVEKEQLFDIEMDILNGIFAKFAEDYKNGYADMHECILKMQQMAHDFGILDGQLQVIERYIANIETMIKESGDYIIVGQVYEGAMRGAAQEHDQKKLGYVNKGVQLENAVKLLEGATNKDRRKQVIMQVKTVIAQFFKAAGELGILQGVVIENQALMDANVRLIQALGGEKAYSIVKDELGAT